MKRAIVIVGALAVVGIILVVLVVPAFMPSNGLDIQFYDENGDPIGTPLAFMSPGGDIVAGFRVTVWWVITGINIDPATIAITGTLKVSMLSTTDHWLTLDSQDISGAGVDSDYSKSYSLDTLLADFMSDEYKTMGWPMKVESTITSQMSDTEGNVLEPQTKTGIATFTITWYEGSYSLESGVAIVYP